MPRTCAQTQKDVYFYIVWYSVPKALHTTVYHGKVLCVYGIFEYSTQNYSVLVFFPFFNLSKIQI